MDLGGGQASGGSGGQGSQVIRRGNESSKLRGFDVGIRRDHAHDNVSESQSVGQNGEKHSAVITIFASHPELKQFEPGSSLICDGNF